VAPSGQGWPILQGGGQGGGHGGVVAVELCVAPGQGGGGHGGVVAVELCVAPGQGGGGQPVVVDEPVGETTPHGGGGCGGGGGQPWLLAPVGPLAPLAPPSGTAHMALGGHLGGHGGIGHAIALAPADEAAHGPVGHGVHGCPQIDSGASGPLDAPDWWWPRWRRSWRWARRDARCERRRAPRAGCRPAADPIDERAVVGSAGGGWQTIAPGDAVPVPAGPTDAVPAVAVPVAEPLPPAAKPGAVPATAPQTTISASQRARIASEDTTSEALWTG
jgi:hypothetical protein